MVNHFKAEFIKKVVVHLLNSKMGQCFDPYTYPFTLTHGQGAQNEVQPSSAASNHPHSSKQAK